jgi:hypothetical protein
MVVASAFVTTPYMAVVLLLLGAVIAVGNTPDENNRIILIAVALMLGSKALEAVPQVGGYLASMFTNLGVAATGAAIMAIALGLGRRVKNDWMPAA